MNDPIVDQWGRSLLRPSKKRSNSRADSATTANTATRFTLTMDIFGCSGLFESDGGIVFVQIPGWEAGCFADRIPAVHSRVLLNRNTGSAADEIEELHVVVAKTVR